MTVAMKPVYLNLCIWVPYGCDQQANTQRKNRNVSKHDHKQLTLENLDLHHLEQNQLKYKRLKGYLVAEVTSGRLKPGDSLPSEQQLTKTLKVARNTVRQAIGELARDGFVRRVPGKGTFVDEKIDVENKINEKDFQLDAHTDNRSCQGLEVFAMVTPETKNAFYPSLLDGFENATSRMHHQMMIGNSRNDLDAQARIMLQLLDKQVAGIAMVPVASQSTPSYQIRQLQQRGIPIVFCHRSVEGIDAPMQSIPFYDMGRKAGEAIIRQGHRRVAVFAYHLKEDGLPQPMVEGLRDSVRAGGGQLPDEFCRQLPFASPELGQHEDETFEALARICRRPDRPTAIMGSFDNLAELLFLQLGRLGLRVPQDISLMGFGGTERRGAVQRQLTSVAVDEAQVGRRAVELLCEIRSGKRSITDNEKIIIPLVMTDGRTLGSAPAEIVLGK